MTDYKIQVTPNINGELFNIRADSVEELETVTAEFAQRAGKIVENLNVLRQVVVADSILTSRSATSGTISGARPAKDMPSSTVDDFNCKHGPMKDHSDKNYKYTHYCPAPRGEQQCDPKGKKR